MIRLLLLAAASTWPAMVMAAESDARWLAATASGVFAVAALLIALAANRSMLRAGDPAVLDRQVARLNAGIVATVFVWGAGAFALGYGLSRLYWQHWWQYAAAMALLASAAAVYARRLDRADSLWSRKQTLALMTTLTRLLGIAAVVGLGFLVASGKLWANKPDWLANHIFVAGGVVIAAVAFIAASTQRSAGAIAQATADNAAPGSNA